MEKELDISSLKFSEGWNGTRVLYRPGSFIALMEIHSWNETERFRVDIGKRVAIDVCSLDADELREILDQNIIPRMTP